MRDDGTSSGSCTHDHTRRWSAAVDRFDAYVFVTPEYDHSIPAALRPSPAGSRPA